MLARTDERLSTDDSGGTLRTAPLPWDRAEVQAFGMKEGGFDLVLCSDCVNEPIYGDSWEDLAESIDTLCGPCTTVLVSVQRRKDDGIGKFLACLARMLIVQQLC